MKTTSKIISLMLIAVMFCTGFAFAETATTGTPAATVADKATAAPASTTADAAATTGTTSSNVPADVAGTSCETAVNALIEAGAVTGDGDDGLYHPNDNLTRAQACIIIVKSINPTTAAVNGTATQLVGSATFPDMKGYGWAENYIVYSVSNAIVKGYPDGTFKPGNNVSIPEMAAMLLRGAKLITDESTMKYPDDYMALAVEKGILTADQLTQTGAATKGMAAQMAYAVLPQLQAAFVAPVDDAAQGTDKDTASSAPSTTGMTFGSASFDANTTTFGGKTIAKNATIYTYGKTADYAADMKMSTSKNDYLENTVYLYKNVTTKAWYKVENGKITSMILPKDVGFSGLVSAVVNGTIATLNYAGEKVTGIESMTATHPITWLTKANLDVAAITGATEGDGQVYELSTTNGEVRKISLPGAAKSKNFKELTNGTYTEVFDYDDRVVTLTDASGVKFEVAENATVYVWDAKDKEYNQGRLGSIKAGKEIRAYQLTDEGSVASIVVINAD